MRIHTRAGRAGFLGYCANVHPGESLQDVLHAIDRFGSAVRETLETPALSLGLWLSDRCLRELQTGRNSELARALEAARLIVVTLNGFPYGNFHAETVKRAVYHPDLTSDARRVYLHGLAQVLCELLPADAHEGTISTLPIGHREERPDDAHTSLEASVAAAQQLCGLCDDLARLRDTTGKSIRICLEPEPGCWLETTDDALQFLCEVLPRVARQRGVARERIEQHLGLCYDTCHQAIGFEDARSSIARIERAGVRIGKVQISSALELEQPSDPEQLSQLMRFAEPRFLHQVRTRDAQGMVIGVDDLEHSATLPKMDPWRVHFHVPIHRERFGSIGTTRPFLESALPALAALEPVPHMEIETYTWSVLPARERPETESALVRGLADEIMFARQQLT